MCSSRAGVLLAAGLLAGCGFLPVGAPFPVVSAGTDGNAALQQLEGIAAPPENRASFPFDQEAYEAAIAKLTRVSARFKPGQAVSEIERVPFKPFEGDPDGGVFELSTPEEREAFEKKLAENPAIDFAEPDYPLFPAAVPAPPDPLWPRLWGLQKIGLPDAWGFPIAPPSLVAVIDTGIDAAHPDFRFLDGHPVVKLGRDFLDNDGDPADDHGHGTHVSGTIAGAYGKTGVIGLLGGIGFSVGRPYGTTPYILAIRSLGRYGGTDSSVAAGIRYAADQGAKVINMSLGGPNSSQTLYSAVKYAASRGVILVAAAGNEGDTKPHYPASYPECISVGASTPTDARASFSVYNAEVDIAAPGTDIVSSIPGTQWASWNGTSMAAPHVAAAAAYLLAAKPSLSAQAVRDALLKSGDPVSGFSLTSSVKRLNLLAALKSIGMTLPTPTPKPSPSLIPKPSPTPTTLPTLSPSPSPNLSPSPSPHPSSSPMLRVVGAQDPFFYNIQVVRLERLPWTPMGTERYKISFNTKKIISLSVTELDNVSNWSFTGSGTFGGLVESWEFKVGFLYRFMVSAKVSDPEIHYLEFDFIPR